MASSERSNTLGLSLWEPTDMPERLDFLQDNQQLEELVGGHLLNTDLHMTPGEKTRLNSPWAYMLIKGNGQGEKWAEPPIPIADLAAFAVFRVMKPLVEVDTSTGITHLHYDICIRNNDPATMSVRPWFNAGGALVSNIYFGRKNLTVGNTKIHLNDNNEYYIAFFLRRLS